MKEELVINSLETTQKKETKLYSKEFLELSEAIEKDYWPEQILECFRDYYSKRSRLTVHKNLIFYDQVRFVPDENCRERILEEAYKLHQGQIKTTHRIAELFWWPGWSLEVRRFIENCLVCEASDRTQRVREPPLYPIIVPSRPWDTLAMDI